MDELACAQDVCERLPGAPPKARAFTLRIGRKAAIPAELDRAYGFSHSVLFPDFPGLVSYGQSLSTKNIRLRDAFLL
jgi:hypothetical protein